MMQTKIVLIFAGLILTSLGSVGARPVTSRLARIWEAKSVDKNQSRARGPAKRVVITGRLTGEGAECQALRANNGALYTLVGNLRGFRAGNRVRVIGEVAEISTCMQGTTLRVVSIKRS